MKNLVISGLISLGLLSTLGKAATAQTYEFFEHKDNSYFSYPMSAKDTDYFSYWVPAYTIGVLTLQNSGRKSDFDISVYDAPNGNRLSVGDAGSITTELVTVPMSSKGRYIYIKIFNYGRASSEYRLYANYVDPFAKLAIAAGVGVFTCNSDAPSNRNMSRATSIIGSTLQGSTLSGVARDAVINEISNEIVAQMGAGCLTEVVINGTASIVQGIYRNYN